MASLRITPNRDWEALHTGSASVSPLARRVVDTKRDVETPLTR